MSKLMQINDYASGRCLAHDVEVDEPRYNEMAQQPQGICLAGDILTPYQIEEIRAQGNRDFTGETTVFCD